MVIKSDTLTELKKNATYSRQYAAALIAHAERIEALIDNEAAVADLGASGAPAERTRTEPAPEPARTEPPAEPARSEPPAENFRVEVPAEPVRTEPPVEPSRTEPPVEEPRIEAPVEPARFVAVPLTLPRPDMVRPNREVGITQADAIKAALRVLGHPASLGEIFNAIKSQRLPVKLTSAENLRLVMSRSEDFESNEAGLWQVKPANSTAGSGRGLGSPETADYATSAQG